MQHGGLRFAEDRALRLVLLGAPGSGKGTQSQLMMRHYGIPQVSTGDLLREAVAKGTALGRAAKAAMDAGKLVDDSIVLGMIRQRLARRDAGKGFILDGFPRNVAQADALGALLEALGQPLDAVVLMKVRDKVLFQRLAGRRTCRRCARVFNVYTNPAPDGGCKGGQSHDLYQRPDDNEDTIGRRLEVYAAQTRPLVAYYRKRGLLRQVDAEGELDVVEMRLEQALGRRSSPRKAASKAVKKAVKKAVAAVRSRVKPTPLQRARRKASKVIRKAGKAGKVRKQAVKKVAKTARRAVRRLGR